MLRGTRVRQEKAQTEEGPRRRSGHGRWIRRSPIRLDGRQPRRSSGRRSGSPEARPGRGARLPYRALHDCRDPRPGRNGESVSGPGPVDQPQRRAEGHQHPPRPLRGGGGSVPRAVPARGPGRRSAHSSEHRGGARHRPGRRKRQPLHRHGARARPGSQEGDPVPGAAARGGGGRDRRADRRRARLRAQMRHRAPRRQAGERPDHRAGTRQDHRFRGGAPAGFGSDALRPVRRLAGVHVARAAQGVAGRRAGGPVLSRCHLLPASDRQGAVRGRERLGGPAPRSSRSPERRSRPSHPAKRRPTSRPTSTRFSRRRSPRTRPIATRQDRRWSAPCGR